MKPPAPFVSITPGVQGGQPCLNGTRLPVDSVVAMFWWHGLDETLASWEHLTKADVLVCCWYEAHYGSMRFKRVKAWQHWANTSGGIYRRDVSYPPTHAEVEAAS
jgi:uncharacterized protein (DUF433 family)